MMSLEITREKITDELCDEVWAELNPYLEQLLASQQAERWLVTPTVIMINEKWVGGLAVRDMVDSAPSSRLAEADSSLDTANGLWNTEADSFVLWD